MKRKSMFASAIAVLLAIVIVLPVLALPYSINTITISGLNVVGYGSTSDGAANVKYIYLSCVIQSSIDGYSYPIKQNAASRVGPGTLSFYLYVPKNYHHGETLRNTCWHTVDYTNGSRWRVQTQKSIYVP